MDALVSLDRYIHMYIEILRYGVRVWVLVHIQIERHKYFPKNSYLGNMYVHTVHVHTYCTYVYKDVHVRGRKLVGLGHRTAPAII